MPLPAGAGDDVPAPCRARPGESVLLALVQVDDDAAVRCGDGVSGNVVEAAEGGGNELRRPSSTRACSTLCSGNGFRARRRSEVQQGLGSAAKPTSRSIGSATTRTQGMAGVRRRRQSAEPAVLLPNMAKIARRRENGNWRSKSDVEADGLHDPAPSRGARRGTGPQTRLSGNRYRR